MFVKINEVEINKLNIQSIRVELEPYKIIYKMVNSIELEEEFDSLEELKEKMEEVLEEEYEI